MDTVLAADAMIVSVLNQGIGRWSVLDYAAYLVVSDYFIPLTICFWMLGLWFRGDGPVSRGRNQRAVLAAAVSLGFANLAVLILNGFFFRERPFVHMELATLFYEPTDSSFPANPAAAAFAAAGAIWLANRRAGTVLFLLAGLWCLARVYSGLFYPTDILAGALIGAAMARLVTAGMKRIEPVPAWVLAGARFLHLA